MAKRQTDCDVNLTSKKQIKRNQIYKSSYSEFKGITSSKIDAEHAYCTICGVNVSIAHGGKSDIVKHVSTAKHKAFDSASHTVQPVSAYFGEDGKVDEVTRAEVLYSFYIIEHNLPIACADHAGALFKAMFPDSKIASKYACARTKTSAIINVMAKTTSEKIAECLRNGVSYALATDGSNDEGATASHLYPIIIRCLDKHGKIVTHLLSLPSSHDSTGNGIFQTINNELTSRRIKWNNCIAIGSDNASVMSGAHRGFISYIQKSQPTVYFAGCPCHLIHIAAEKAAKILPVSIEELLIDIYYYLDKSTKRNHNLKHFQQLCGTDVRKILKYCSTRWLSLGQCIVRLLSQWEPLTMFFRNECGNSSTTLSAASKTKKINEHIDTYATLSANARPVSDTSTSSSSSTGKIKEYEAYL